jgi:hypothetical protein
MLYGRNLAPVAAGPVVPVLEAGVLYVALLVVAAGAAAVVGMERLGPPFARLPRWMFRALDIAVWLTFIALFNFLSGVYAHGLVPPSHLLDPWEGVLYFLVHSVALVWSFRKMYGLLRPLLGSPTPEFRRPSVAARLMGGALFWLLLATQIPLAIVYGALGPNPAKRVTPITIATSSMLSTEAARPREYLLLYETTHEFVAFDADSNLVVRFPRSSVGMITLPHYSHRQERLLAHLSGGRTLSPDDVDAILAVRPAIARTELMTLLRDGEVERTNAGRLRR